MNLDERIDDRMDHLYWDDAWGLAREDVKQLIREVVAEIKPEPIYDNTAPAREVVPEIIRQYEAKAKELGL